jgi:hypothetical protein
MLGYCTTLIALIAGCSSDTTIGTMGTNRVGTVILTQRRWGNLNRTAT